MNEWSLLIFTYMMNAAAGLCVVSGGGCRASQPLPPGRQL